MHLQGTRTQTDFFWSVPLEKRYTGAKTGIDYSTFGAPLPGRKYLSNVGNKYRYGFNGQEKDNEVAGDGNSYTAEFWQYDSRLGRRWNIDPVVKEWESPYATFKDNPIFYIDPYGDDPVKKLSISERVVNFFKGDSYKNKANKYLVENNIDDWRVTYKRNSVIIDESYYTTERIGNDHEDQSYEMTLHIKDTYFGKDGSYRKKDYFSYSRENSNATSLSWKTPVGLILVLLGDNSLATRGKLGGAIPGTSLASKYLSKKFPTDLSKQYEPATFDGTSS